MIGAYRKLAVLLLAGAWSAALSTEPAPGAAATAFATVDDVVITTHEVEATLATAVARRFYHRRPREEQLAALRREVSDGLVNRVLLVKEARRRGFEPDREKLDHELAALRPRVHDDAQWERLRPALALSLEERDLVTRLEAATRSGREPEATDLEAYYGRHGDMFTEPERIGLSIILVKVDPSSPRETWAQARARADGLAQRLAAGGDFAALAREHSGHESAANGGDVGYLHRGMVTAHVEQLLDALPVGAVSDPIDILEGVALFRVTDRKAARQRPLAEVSEHVAELWRTEQGEKRWRELIAALRARSVITTAAGDATPSAPAAESPHR